MSDKPDSNQKPKSFSESEEEILGFWENNKIFERLSARTKKSNPFVFFEGPPTANGRPGIHHVVGRAFKDIILRYKTMRGFWVWRRAGWDTHGLPVELEVEKKLGLKSKKDIERYGIANFNQKCKESVWRYKEEWEHLTKRMGFWLDMDDPYITYEPRYIENLWAVIKRFWERGLLKEDFKVIPFCVRCGTAVSSHEVAQGYETITDVSVIVKFPISPAKRDPATRDNFSRKTGSRRAGQFSKKTEVENQKVYLLAWTTTPWTLPGNVALAVHPDVSYVEVEKKDEDGGQTARFILAKERLAEVFGDGSYTIMEELKGSDLLGIEYEPLFVVPELRNDKSFKVYPADFVNTEEGTGIVHTAVMYGVDDFELGNKIGLPKFHTVNEEGRFVESVPVVGGKAVVSGEEKDKETEGLILNHLAKKGLLFKKENYEHEYPFCWRCKTPLLYYARRSWFVGVSAERHELIKNNKKINWIPEHLKEGRFGEWLKDAKDWAISRERYWGTTLPIWKCEKCEEIKVIGSFKELDENAPKDFGRTKVFIMRHGEASHNVKGIVGPATTEHDSGNHLTPKGAKSVEKTAKTLKKEKINLIISSPLLRAKETSKILADILGVKIKISENIYDYNLGEFQGRKIKDVRKEFSFERKLREPFPKGESLREVRARMMDGLKRIVKENKGKRIIVVSHGDPLWISNAALEGKYEDEYEKSWYPKTGEAKELKLHNWPYGNSGELDPHRPYADEIKLECGKCGGLMARVKEVADVWFDSGAMPFAQPSPKNSPVKKLGEPPKGQFPADYIAEAIDQTRGWFYTLHAVSALLDKGPGYKNVISHGHVLDEKGKKMSKSRGNAVEPMPLFEKYGADAVRWYFYTVNQPWDEKLFKESDIADASKRFLNIFWNSFVYWKTYETISKRKTQSAKPQRKNSKLLINKWAWARLNQVGFEVTRLLEKYDIVKAARAIENFVAEDLSRWYIRRVRDQIRFGAKKEKEEISGVFGNILYEAAKISAPFIPFLTDRMHLEAGGPNKSLHLDKWKAFKKPNKVDLRLIAEMDEVKRVVSLALEARARAEIKVRQPLTRLRVRSKKLDVRNKELIELIKGEVNVKEIVFDPKIKEEVELDTVMTPELKEEGQLRELIRQIQNGRKKAGLKPSDKIIFVAVTDNKGETFVKKHEAILKKEAGIKTISFGESAKPGRLVIVLKFNHV